MKINQNELLNKLDSIPLGEPISEGLNKTENTSIKTNINMSKNIHNSSSVIICVIICAALIVIATLYANILPIKQTTHIEQIQKISEVQADEIKSLVKEVSACQNKAPITVHNDLKKIFKYYRYREIDLATYDKIMVYLKSQNCQ